MQRNIHWNGKNTRVTINKWKFCKKFIRICCDTTCIFIWIDPLLLFPTHKTISYKLYLTFVLSRKAWNRKKSYKGLLYKKGFFLLSLICDLFVLSFVVPPPLIFCFIFSCWSAIKHCRTTNNLFFGRQSYKKTFSLKKD